MGGGQVRAPALPGGARPSDPRIPRRPPARPPAPSRPELPDPRAAGALTRGGWRARARQGDGGSPWRDAGVKQRVGMWLRDKGTREGGGARLELLGRVGVEAPRSLGAAPEKPAASPGIASRRVRVSPPRPPSPLPLESSFPPDRAPMSSGSESAKRPARARARPKPRPPRAGRRDRGARRGVGEGGGRELRLTDFPTW